MARIILYCYVTDLLEFLNPGDDLCKHLTENDFVACAASNRPLFGAAYFHLSHHIFNDFIEVDICSSIKRIPIFVPG